MDRDLVERAQQGDTGAFESLAVASHARLYRVARGILRDDDLADDAVQRALVQIWRRLRQLRDPERFEGWSYRLLVNTCYEEARRSGPRIGADGLDPTPEPIEADVFRAVDDRDELERGFRRISVKHRAVIVLHYLLDLPIEQVAEALDIPTGTVNSRLHRAMSLLRAEIEADARMTARTRSAREATR
jgi:RNA polymerase sigma-70 factor (ECF subfamily)